MDGGSCIHIYSPWIGRRDGTWIGRRDGTWIGRRDGTWIGRKDGTLTGWSDAPCTCIQQTLYRTSPFHIRHTGVI